MRKISTFLLFAFGALLALTLFSCKTSSLVTTTTTKTDSSTTVRETIRDTTLKLPTVSGGFSISFPKPDSAGTIILAPDTVETPDFEFVTTIKDGRLNVHAKTKPKDLTLKGVLKEKETDKTKNTVKETKTEKTIIEKPSAWSQIKNLICLGASVIVLVTLISLARKLGFF